MVNMMTAPVDKVLLQAMTLGHILLMLSEEFGKLAQQVLALQESAKGGHK